MANKTQPTDASAAAYIASVDHPVRQADANVVLAMMERISGCPAVMWGESLIGFGRYQYKYESGREGEFFILGLAPRKQRITLYLMPGYQDFTAYLARLGKHKIGKSCLHINKLADVDLTVLEALVREAWQQMAQRNIATAK